MLAAAEKEYILSSPPEDGISCVKFCPWKENLLLATSWDCTARIYDVEKNTVLKKFTLAAPVLDAAWVAANMIATAGLEGVVRVHAIDTGKEFTLGSHESPVRTLAYEEREGILFSGSWDKTVKLWRVHPEELKDADADAAPAAAAAAAGKGGKYLAGTLELPERVYTLSLAMAAFKSNLIVGCAARQTAIYNLEKVFSAVAKGSSLADAAGAGAADSKKLLAVAPAEVRQSLLKHQTRFLSAFPDGTGYVTASIEGRCSVDFIEEDAGAKKGFAFKCHRIKLPSGDERIFPVHAVAFHPGLGTFATGGGDCTVQFWDYKSKKRISSGPEYKTSIASLSFSKSGTLLAMAVSYCFEQGERDHPSDDIVIHKVQPSEVAPRG